MIIPTDRFQMHIPGTTSQSEIGLDHMSVPPLNQALRSGEGILGNIKLNVEPIFTGESFHDRYQGGKTQLMMIRKRLKPGSTRWEIPSSPQHNYSPRYAFFTPSSASKDWVSFSITTLPVSNTYPLCAILNACHAFCSTSRIVTPC